MKTETTVTDRDNLMVEWVAKDLHELVAKKYADDNVTGNTFIAYLTLNESYTGGYNLNDDNSLSSHASIEVDVDSDEGECFDLAVTLVNVARQAYHMKLINELFPLQATFEANNPDGTMSDCIIFANGNGLLVTETFAALKHVHSGDDVEPIEAVQSSFANGSASPAFMAEAESIQTMRTLQRSGNTDFIVLDKDGKVDLVSQRYGTGFTVVHAVYVQPSTQRVFIELYNADRFVISKAWEVR